MKILSILVIPLYWGIVSASPPFRELHNDVYDLNDANIRRNHDERNAFLNNIILNEGQSDNHVTRVKHHKRSLLPMPDKQVSILPWYNGEKKEKNILQEIVAQGIELSNKIIGGAIGVIEKLVDSSKKNDKKQLISPKNPLEIVSKLSNDGITPQEGGNLNRYETLTDEKNNEKSKVAVNIPSKLTRYEKKEEEKEDNVLRQKRGIGASDLEAVHEISERSKDNNRMAAVLKNNHASVAETLNSAFAIEKNIAETKAAAMKAVKFEDDFDENLQLDDFRKWIEITYRFEDLPVTSDVATKSAKGTSNPKDLMEKKQVKSDETEALTNSEATAETNATTDNLHKNDEEKSEEESDAKENVDQQLKLKQEPITEPYDVSWILKIVSPKSHKTEFKPEKNPDLMLETGNNNSSDTEVKSDTKNSNRDDEKESTNKNVKLKPKVKLVTKPNDDDWKVKDITIGRKVKGDETETDNGPEETVETSARRGIGPQKSDEENNRVKKSNAKKTDDNKTTIEDAISEEIKNIKVNDSKEQVVTNAEATVAQPKKASEMKVIKEESDSKEDTIEENIELATTNSTPEIGSTNKKATSDSHAGSENDNRGTAADVDTQTNTESTAQSEIKHEISDNVSDSSVDNKGENQKILEKSGFTKNSSHPKDQQSKKNNLETKIEFVPTQKSKGLVSSNEFKGLNPEVKLSSNEEKLENNNNPKEKSKIRLPKWKLHKKEETESTEQIQKGKALPNTIGYDDLHEKTIQINNSPDTDESHKPDKTIFNDNELYWKWNYDNNDNLESYDDAYWKVGDSNDSGSDRKNNEEDFKNYYNPLWYLKHYNIKNIPSKGSVSTDNPELKWKHYRDQFTERAKTESHVLIPDNITHLNHRNENNIGDKWTINAHTEDRPNTEESIREKEPAPKADNEEWKRKNYTNWSKDTPKSVESPEWKPKHATYNHSDINIKHIKADNIANEMQITHQNNKPELKQESAVKPDNEERKLKNTADRSQNKHKRIEHLEWKLKNVTSNIRDKSVKPNRENSAIDETETTDLNRKPEIKLKPESRPDNIEWSMKDTTDWAKDTPKSLENLKWQLINLVHNISDITVKPDVAASDAFEVTPINLNAKARLEPQPASKPDNEGRKWKDVTGWSQDKSKSVESPEWKLENVIPNISDTSVKPSKSDSDANETNTTGLNRKPKLELKTKSQPDSKRWALTNTTDWTKDTPKSLENLKWQLINLVHNISDITVKPDVAASDAFEVTPINLNAKARLEPQPASKPDNEGRKWKDVTGWSQDKSKSVESPEWKLENVIPNISDTSVKPSKSDSDANETNTTGLNRKPKLELKTKSQPDSKRWALTNTTDWTKDTPKSLENLKWQLINLVHNISDITVKPDVTASDAFEVTPINLNAKARLEPQPVSKPDNEGRKWKDVTGWSQDKSKSVESPEWKLENVIPNISDTSVKPSKSDSDANETNTTGLNRKPKLELKTKSQPDSKRWALTNTTDWTKDTPKSLENLKWQLINLVHNISDITVKPDVTASDAFEVTPINLNAKARLEPQPVSKPDNEGRKWKDVTGWSQDKSKSVESPEWKLENVISNISDTSVKPSKSDSDANETNTTGLNRKPKLELKTKSQPDSKRWALTNTTDWTKDTPKSLENLKWQLINLVHNISDITVKPDVAASDAFEVTPINLNAKARLEPQPASKPDNERQKLKDITGWSQDKSKPVESLEWKLENVIPSINDTSVKLGKSGSDANETNTTGLNKKQKLELKTESQPDSKQWALTNTTDWTKDTPTSLENLKWQLIRLVHNISDITVTTNVEESDASKVKPINTNPEARLESKPPSKPGNERRKLKDFTRWSQDKSKPVKSPEWKLENVIPNIGDTNVKPSKSDSDADETNTMGLNRKPKLELKTESQPDSKQWRLTNTTDWAEDTPKPLENLKWQLMNLVHNISDITVKPDNGEWTLEDTINWPEDSPKPVENPEWQLKDLTSNISSTSAKPDAEGTDAFQLKTIDLNRKPESGSKLASKPDDAGRELNDITDRSRPVESLKWKPKDVIFNVSDTIVKPYKAEGDADEEKTIDSNRKPELELKSEPRPDNKEWTLNNTTEWAKNTPKPLEHLKWQLMNLIYNISDITVQPDVEENKASEVKPINLNPKLELKPKPASKPDNEGWKLKDIIDWSQNESKPVKSFKWDQKDVIFNFSDTTVKPDKSEGEVGGEKNTDLNTKPKQKRKPISKPDSGEWSLKDTTDWTKYSPKPVENLKWQLMNLVHNISNITVKPDKSEGVADEEENTDLNTKPKLKRKPITKPDNGEWTLKDTTDWSNYNSKPVENPKWQLMDLIYNISDRNGKYDTEDSDAYEAKTADLSINLEPASILASKPDNDEWKLKDITEWSKEKLGTLESPEWMLKDVTYNSSGINVKSLAGDSDGNDLNWMVKDNSGTPDNGKDELRKAKHVEDAKWKMERSYDGVAGDKSLKLIDNPEWKVKDRDDPSEEMKDGWIDKIEGMHDDTKSRTKDRAEVFNHVKEGSNGGIHGTDWELKDDLDSSTEDKFVESVESKTPSDNEAEENIGPIDTFKLYEDRDDWKFTGDNGSIGKSLEQIRDVDWKLVDLNGNLNSSEYNDFLIKDSNEMHEDSESSKAVSDILDQNWKIKSSDNDVSEKLKNESSNDVTLHVEKFNEMKNAPSIAKDAVQNDSAWKLKGYDKSNNANGRLDHAEVVTQNESEQKSNDINDLIDNPEPNLLMDNATGNSKRKLKEDDNKKNDTEESSIGDKKNGIYPEWNSECKDENLKKLEGNPNEKDLITVITSAVISAVDSESQNKTDEPKNDDVLEVKEDANDDDDDDNVHNERHSCEKEKGENVSVVKLTRGIVGITQFKSKASTLDVYRSLPENVVKQVRKLLQEGEVTSYVLSKT